MEPSVAKCGAVKHPDVIEVVPGPIVRIKEEIDALNDRYIMKICESKKFGFRTSRQRSNKIFFCFCFFGI